ncbi:MAG: 16S rRNA (guanine(966)-N(2))-methyltransferase RsmD [Candidatus Acetothermia bacterium]|nr:16S rRNA (guanine(966)-N(2))-methyltransferase RsmD [Candidatus Acetothermia bacterium]
MRIIGGAHRGRKLAEWHGTDIRPLRDRVRTALFDTLGGLVAGAEFLDLFAGTGAVGLEALSRGARRAVFVDSSPHAVRLIQENIRRLGYRDRTEVLRLDALAGIRVLAEQGRAFELAFVGAPYESGLAQRAVAALGEFVPLAPGALVVVETFHKEGVAARYGALRLELQRAYGETRLSFYRFVPDEMTGYTAPQQGVDDG